MDLADAYSAAARAKGRPLRTEELVEAARTYWKERFENVIRLAGYSENAVRSICDEWLPKYLAGDMRKFEEMLESYERSNGDPE